MTLIYGWGNPIFGKDGIGIQVAQKLKKKELPKNISVEWSSSSPFSIVQTFLNHEEVILIDACQLPEKQEGEILEFNLTCNDGETDFLTPHSASLTSVLDLYREIYPKEVPELIHVIGICVKDVELTDKVPTNIQEKIDKIVNRVLARIEKIK